MSLASQLDKEIQNGMADRTGIIPIQLNRLGDYIEICKNTYYNIGGETGSGKTSFVQDIFVIRVIEWYLLNRPENMKLSIIGFFMERKMYQYTARWISRKLFEDKGIRLSAKRILNRKKEFRLTKEEYGSIQEYYDMLDEWEKDDLLIVHEGSKNPSGISLYLEMFAKKHGTVHKVEKRDKDNRTLDNVLLSTTYTPNHPNHIVLVIGDNSDILAPEDGKEERQLVVKYSRTLREARDIYGFSPVNIQQLNGELGDIARHKMGDLAPKLKDFATSKQTLRDSDVVMALFNPYDHKVSETTHNGYDLKRLKDDKFRTYYRSLHLLKNSFDSSGMSFPLAIQPEYGIFKTLPRKDGITESIYDEVMSGSYFMSEMKEEFTPKRAFSGFGNRDKIMETVNSIIS